MAVRLFRRQIAVSLHGGLSDGAGLGAEWIEQRTRFGGLGGAQEPGQCQGRLILRDEYCRIVDQRAQGLRAQIVLAFGEVNLAQRVFRKRRDL